MKHVILVGACYLDTILTVNHFPQEDSKLRATAVQHRRGGNCPNTLQVFRQLLLARHQQQNANDDVKIHLVSPLPRANSAATLEILSSFFDPAEVEHEQPGLAGENIRGGVTTSFRHCLYRDSHDEPASSYIVRSSTTGSRTIINFNDLPEMTTAEFVPIADEITKEADGGSCWWHFEGRIPETTLQCIRHLRMVSPASSISVEVEKPNREGLTELAAEADVVFYSRSWAESRGYASAEACLRGEAPSSSRAALMFCTWAAFGASAHSNASGECITYRPSGGDIQVVEANPLVRQLKKGKTVEGGVSQSVTFFLHRGLTVATLSCTVGAGDSFIAGILHGLICCASDQSQEATLAFAVELATKKVQREGFAGLTGA